jgi:hypothetical protein
MKSKSNLPDRTCLRHHFPHIPQFRLLLVAVLLFLVSLLIWPAADPDTWGRLFIARGALPTDEIDTRLGRDQAPAPSPGVFISKPAAQAESAADAEDYLPGVSVAMLDRLRDDAVFRREERDVWFAFLAAVSSATAADLQDRSVGLVGFSQLYRQPAQYRGRVVTLRGTVRRAIAKQAHQNDSQIDRYWQCWLFPEGSDNPVVVYALRLPDGFPQGQLIREAASVDGLYYKRWVYLAEDGLRTAPVVVARTLGWQHRPDAVPPALPAFPLVFAGVLVAVAVAAACTYYVFRS